LGPKWILVTLESMWVTSGHLLHIALDVGLWNQCQKKSWFVELPSRLTLTKALQSQSCRFHGVGVIRGIQNWTQQELHPRCMRNEINCKSTLPGGAPPWLSKHNFHLA
jgi:hypothetical protein